MSNRKIIKHFNRLAKDYDEIKEINYYYSCFI